MVKMVGKIASLVAAGAFIAGMAASAHAEDTKITLGMSGWTGFAPLTLADKAGIFKKNGLEVDLRMIPQQSRQLALASGAIQCAATTVETHVAWNANGVPITQIFQMDKSYGADGLAVCILDCCARSGNLGDREGTGATRGPNRGHRAGNPR